MSVQEKERKELNRKLIKKTFATESKGKKFIIEFIGLFIAFLIADLVVEILKIDYWLFDMLISIGMIMIMQIFLEKIKGRLNNRVR